MSAGSGQDEPPMTRNVDESAMGWELAELKEQLRAREHIKRVFGREPESALVATSGGWLRELCYVRVRFGLGSPVEFIVANGLLIAIPPKRRWQS